MTLPHIAVVGPMHSGKTTLAHLVVERLGYTRLALADPVKDAVEWACNQFIAFNLGYFPDRQDALGMHGAPPILIDRQEIEDAKHVFRPILQWWGTEFARQYLKNDRVWIEMFLDRLRHTIGPVVTDDVRFPNEAQALRDVGFRIVRIVRPEEDRLDSIGSQQTMGELSHASEIALNAIVPDTTITNDGTVDELFTALTGVLLTH
jgi:hypothetical protein